jgi:hypothetical protein
MISLNNVNRLFLSLLLLCGPAQAAEPEFKSTVVTESRTYERQSSSFSVAGIPAGSTRVPMSRVTVALDGLLVTGEWEPKTLQSATAKSFRRGTDVPAAVSRNRLLLQLPDGSVVTTKIVKREKQKPPELDRRARD